MRSMRSSKSKHSHENKEMSPQKLAQLKRRQELAEAESKARNDEGNAIARAAKNGDVDEIRRKHKDSRFPDIINFKDSSGFTPLMKAAMYDHQTVVHALIDLGADLEISESRGRTALMLAAANGFTSTCKLLIAAGAQSESARS